MLSLLRAYVAMLTGRHQLAYGAEGRWSRLDVMRGYDLAYGDQTNCLQAIALAEMVGWAFSSEDGLTRNGQAKR